MMMQMKTSYWATPYDSLKKNPVQNNKLIVTFFLLHMKNKKGEKQTKQIQTNL